MKECEPLLPQSANLKARPLRRLQETDMEPPVPHPFLARREKERCRLPRARHFTGEKDAPALCRDLDARQRPPAAKLSGKECRVNRLQGVEARRIVRAT